MQRFRAAPPEPPAARREHYQLPSFSQSGIGFYGITVLVDYAIAWRIRSERIALLTEVIEMDWNIKRLV
ncbi:MAG: hypothetical protein U9N07_08610, partial [Euryarchaeota archaeon]|nr:hypothetical protein [Euryarchaeota archaeon]